MKKVALVEFYEQQPAVRSRKHQANTHKYVQESITVRKQILISDLHVISYRSDLCFLVFGSLWSSLQAGSIKKSLLATKAYVDAQDHKPLLGLMPRSIYIHMKARPDARSLPTNLPYQLLTASHLIFPCLKICTNDKESPITVTQVWRTEVTNIRVPVHMQLLNKKRSFGR